MPYTTSTSDGKVTVFKKSGKHKEVVGHTTPKKKNAYLAALHIHSKDKKKNTKKEGIEEGITEMYAVQNPYSGCQPQDLVTPFNPVHGVPHDVMTPDVVHSVHPDVETATAIAEALCQEMIQYEGMLEEKKGSTAEKLKKALHKLERERKEHVDAVKENPKSASQHKEKIAHLTSRIDDLMTKMERVEKSKKEPKKEEE